ncbi:MAG: NMD3-related protein [Candidatus Anstonellaceae archaeon]
MCGKSDLQSEFFGELCVECAKSRMEPLAPVRITTCQKCAAVIGKSRERKEATFEEEVIRLLKLKGKNAAFDAKRGEVEYETPYGKVRQPVLVLVDKGVCTVCGRAGTQYFEAIIQLRGRESQVAKMTHILVHNIEEKSFVPKVEELREGTDIYCGSRNEAIAALNMHKLGFVRTEKLAGERNGKRLYRTTLLVRF